MWLERQKERGRDTERWRFSHGNWPIFLMNAYERRAASHLCSGTKKRLAKIGTLQIGGSDFHAHGAQSVASADVYHRHRMKTHFALPGCLPGND